MKKLLLVILCFAIFMGIGSCLVSVVETGEKGNNSITDKDESSSNSLLDSVTSSVNKTEENTSNHDSLLDIIGDVSASEPEAEESESVSEEVVEGEVSFSGKLCLYSISSGKYISDVSGEADVNELGEDEYYNFIMQVRNTTSLPFSWQEAYVQVNGGEKWYWAAGEIPAKSGVNFPIAYTNMKNMMAEGAYTVDWYIDGNLVHSEEFALKGGRKWQDYFEIPDTGEINAHNETSNLRSPYLSGWLMIPKETRYTEYCIDFRADHLPRGTYCCLGNWTMDYSYLDSIYEKVETEYGSVHAYAGFQRVQNGDMKAIMSFWDIFCTDAAGNQTTIRAEQIYPETDNAEGFTGEGTGAHVLVPYEWEAGHWYRMHLRCYTSETTGNTVVEQWVCDLETEEYTLLSAYDTGVKNSAFKGETAIFLENYLPQWSGNLRSMEVKNAMYLDEATNNWYAIDEIYLSSNGGLPNYEGSYNFGVDEKGVYMITSGVGGDWFNNGKGKQGDFYTIK